MYNLVYSWLVKHPGYSNFDLESRDPSCLPKEFKNIDGGTCYFLNGYKHPGVAPDADLNEHIDTAMKQIMPAAPPPAVD